MVIVKEAVDRISGPSDCSVAKVGLSLPAKRVEPFLVTGAGRDGGTGQKEGGGGGRQRQAGMCVRWGINGF